MYEIIPYDPTLKAEVVALQRHLWPGDLAMSRAYFEWKYERSPYFAEPLLYLALSGGRVVGIRGMFGSRWEVGPASSDFSIPAADDLVIAPDHRGRGLFARIMRAALDDLASRGHAYAFSLSPGPVTLADSLATGWRAVGSLRAVQREAPLSAFISRLRRRVGHLPGLWRHANALASLDPAAWSAPFARLDRRGGSTAAGAGMRVEGAPRVGAMADLVRRLGHDGRLRHVRDETYLAWRFENPLHDYRFLVCGSDRLEGYLVLQAYRLRPRHGVNIVDWEGTEPRVRSMLLRTAIEWGRFVDLRAWTAALPADAPTVLGDAGFVPVEPSPGPFARNLPSVLVRAVQAGRPASEPMLGERRLLDPATWDMRMLYSMAG